MKSCPKCGNILDGNDSYCQKCGLEINSSLRKQNITFLNKEFKPNTTIKQNSTPYAYVSPFTQDFQVIHSNRNSTFDRFNNHTMFLKILLFIDYITLVWPPVIGSVILLIISILDFQNNQIFFTIFNIIFTFLLFSIFFAWRILFHSLEEYNNNARKILLIFLYSLLFLVILFLFLEILGFNLFIGQTWQYNGILLESNSIFMYGDLSEILSIVYLVFQIYTLSFHKDTVNLFKNTV